LIGESFIAYYESVADATPQEVLLCDQHFDVSYKHMLGKLGITVDNSYRKLFFTCPSRNLDEYHDQIAKMAFESEWCRSHAFQSFAPQRELISAKFYIDGEEYFGDVADALEKAESSIYISDWWLSPELYLRRPSSQFPESRLDKVLFRCASQGVKIYIILFKEMYGSLTINSYYSKEVLRRLHRNIYVVRHPDHLAAGVIKWAHHEKMVVVDQRLAFVGGLDLCYGRFDSRSHELADPSSVRWPGKDYSNPLFKDFHGLELPDQDMVDRNVIPRMPWHDIGLRVEGQAARDVARHFIGRWNTCKVNKEQSKESKIPFLTPRADFMPAADVPTSTLLNSASVIVKDIPVLGTHQVQILRSAARWSSGIFTESSILNAYLGLIEEAKHYIYIENQFFITSSTLGVGQVSNKIGLALYNRIKTAHEGKERLHVFVVLPLKPAFEGEVDRPESFALRKVMDFQYRSICRDKGQSLLELLAKDGIPAEQYITFHGLRTYSEMEGALITEQIYIHSKCLIVDDKVAIVGSANLNDRSMLGHRDSEIAACITDAEEISTRMNGKPYRASRSVFEFRCKLFEEHLGLQPSKSPGGLEVQHLHQVVEDPISEAFLHGPWLSTSQNNSL